tara:strand:+ start:269 stop:508 length:240 start_codon:yes stop_codon:yes gene_type:complete
MMVFNLSYEKVIKTSLGLIPASFQVQEARFRAHIKMNLKMVVEVDKSSDYSSSNKMLQITFHFWNVYPNEASSLETLNK